MFKKIIRSIKRSGYKRNVINTILSNNQKNDSVINMHRIDTRNAGDYYCAPHHYFEQLKDTALDILAYRNDNRDARENFIVKTSNNAVIVGGGGLLNRNSFKKQLQLVADLTEKGKKTVLWGVGHNEKSPNTYGKVTTYNIDISKYGLAGTRDYNMPGEFVPCVSCLHTAFDTKIKTIQDVGIVFHKDTLKEQKITEKFKNYPTSSNTSDFEDIIKFIGSSEKIITDSYHTMYWAMLLEKKVAVVPNSSKFYDFKHMPVITTFDNALNDIGKTQSFSGLLDECREINHKFADKVFDYLNL